MLIDDGDDSVLDETSHRVANEELFLREKVVDTVEVYSSKRHA
jgi:hypothetical protein